MVVMVGVDVHKDTHCAVAVDATGRQVGAALTVRASDAGHLQLLSWAEGAFDGAPVMFAVEDCRHVSTRLERALLAAGARVVRVPPKLMAGTRRSARTRGKSDPIDALAIARAALREPNLAVAEHTDATRELRLLVEHRENLVRMRTAIQNRLRWHLHELDPELDPPVGSLGRASQLDRIQARLESLPPDTVRRLALELVADVRTITARITALGKELAGLVAATDNGRRLLALPGCGGLTAAKILGETANPDRFRSEACFAMHAAVAPIPASSSRTNRHRLARGGNRQLNTALYRIAFTQIRLDGPGQALYQRRRAQGDTTAEALRVLKRRLARIVFNALTANPNRSEATQPQAA